MRTANAEIRDQRRGAKSYLSSAGERTRVLIYSPLVSDVSNLSSRRGTETSQPRYTRSLVRSVSNSRNLGRVFVK